MKQSNYVHTGEPLYFFYSGPLSHRFWERINALKKHERIYELGVMLQNLEGYMIDELLEAEREENVHY